MTEIGKEIAKARALLERGLTVAIPTETVYGLAANALDADAVLQIFEIKNRPHFDPLIVHTDSIEKIIALVAEIPDWARVLAETFWPGPLTLVLAKKKSIPDLVTSGLDTVAVRIPSHQLTLDLLSQLDFPLAAPSANPFGYISPTTAQHVYDQLGGKIPYILDGGPCSIGIESTILTEIEGKITVLRLGGLSLEEIESQLGPITHAATHIHQSPGSLDNHYAPRTPLKIGINLEDYDPKEVGIISFGSRLEAVRATHQVDLSPEQDFRQAARSLFAAMRYLDGLKLKVILTEELPNVGLGRAINDRLRRAGS